MLSRRNFIKAASATAIATSSPNRLWARAVSQAPKAKITKIEVVTWKGPKKTAAHLEIVSDAGAVGRFGPLGWGLDARLEKLAPKLGELLIAKDPLDRSLEFETLWNVMYPAHPLTAYAEGIDPLTGKRICGRTRGKKQRHTETGLMIMALSSVDNALWDLRGKLLGKPVHRLIGKANRF
ncbi:MAG: twin-arginine translocation signal domain-containing protein [Planctomycetes bacterium]|nr:twin-arginine translocation signal domain-containing protein [Planctomycetota bacterium]